MTRKTFLTLCALVAFTIGIIALFFPSVLLVEMKYATPNSASITMARTVGVLLISFSILNFLVRGDGDTPTMASILIANLLLQLFILPIDPLAYVFGVYGSPMSFIPNTILHLLLLSGFVYFLIKMRRDNAEIGR